MTTGNLIPAPRLRARANRLRIRLWAGGCVALAALLAAGCAVCHVVWGGEQAALGQESGRTEAEIGRTKQAIRQFARDLAQAQWRLDSCRAVGRQPDWSVALALVAANIGPEVVLDHCQLAWERDAPAAEPASPGAPDKGRAQPEAAVKGRFIFKLSGFARTQNAVSLFVLGLEKTALFDRVRLVKTARRPFMADQAIEFRLECVLEGKAAA